MPRRIEIFCGGLECSGFLTLLVMLALPSVQAAELDPSDPEDSVVLFRKLACLQA